MIWDKMSCINGCMVRSNLLISLVPYLSPRDGKERKYNFVQESKKKPYQQDKQGHAEVLGLSLPEYILIPIAVGLGVGLMILFNVTHPPAGGNPVIIIIGGVSINYLFSPIITGSILILVFGVVLNRFILKKNYPK